MEVVGLHDSSGLMCRWRTFSEICHNESMVLGPFAGTALFIEEWGRIE